MTDTAIIEVAARALAQTYDGINEWEGYQERTRENCRMMARSVLAAVTPLIRAAALEEAAEKADEWTGCNFDGAAYAIAKDIRALKEHP